MEEIYENILCKISWLLVSKWIRAPRNWWSNRLKFILLSIQLPLLKISRSSSSKALKQLWISTLSNPTLSHSSSTTRWTSSTTWDRVSRGFQALDVPLLTRKLFQKLSKHSRTKPLQVRGLLPRSSGAQVRLSEDIWSWWFLVIM